METKNSFSWKDLLYQSLSHWKWFVISLFVCLAAVFYKIASSNEIFEVSASLLIKSDDKGSNARQAREAFDIMGIGSLGSNVHNELLTLSSPTLMSEVIEQLRLNEEYKIKSGLKVVNLYKQEPLLVMFSNPGALPLVTSMDIKIIDASNYQIKNLKASSTKHDGVFNVTAGIPINTPVGEIVLSPSQQFSNNYIGKTLSYQRIEASIVADLYVNALQVVIPDREASVISITNRDASIIKSKDIISTLIDVYNKNWEINKNARNKSISDFVDARLEVIANELDDIDRKMSSYMTNNLVTDVSQVSREYFSQNLELNKEIVNYRTQSNIAKSMLASLSDTQGFPTLPANSGLMDNSISQQIQEYNKLIIERSKLLANTNENNSIIIDMTKAVETIRQNVVQSLEGFVKNNDMIVKSLEGQVSLGKSQLSKAPDQARHLANIQREQKIKEELYLFLLEKKEENDMSQAYASDNSQIIVSPHSTYLPIKPNKPLLLFVALMIGLAIPFVILLVKFIFDDVVHSKEDLKELRATYLGNIPNLNNKKRWDRWIKKKNNFEIVVKKNSTNIGNEAFRILRTNLDFINQAGNYKVFITTSLMPGSGKTFTTLNLAASYALKGKKVLVMDVDMRMATASKYFLKTTKHIGIADYLSGYSNDSEEIIIKKSIMDEIDFIPVGTIPPNPAELILSERLKNLIEELRSAYDYIFLDTPPIDVVAESGVIAGFADMALFVVRAGQFPVELLSEINDLYDQKKFKNIVVILNAVKHESGYGYGKYGYGHYGKYGYGHYYTTD
ncbi:MAG: polysaccharide biosynthesis tyrosine autokinase [Bacteroidales bacterium]|nr:polysaccharide biosynthesis tyrosine autokinase [Bacteroidales bacterium]